MEDLRKSSESKNLITGNQRIKKATEKSMFFRGFSAKSYLTIHFLHRIS